MPKYIFLDNWVFSHLTSPQYQRSLLAFLNEERYTVLITSLSLVELYNSNWQTAGSKDRALQAAQFLAQVPAVIVKPERVYEAEVAAYLSPIEALPLELDLRSLPTSVRGLTLLQLLRRDELYLKQGIDIREWSDHYAALKQVWLRDVQRIIDQACQDDNLKRDASGHLVNLQDYKERFLYSLDFRQAKPTEIDGILAKRLEMARAGVPTRLTAIRLSSLCFWYAYVAIDKANRPKQAGSDIGDFFHISFLPYCAAFTLDKSMHRLIRTIREPVVPVTCQLITKNSLSQILHSEKNGTA